MSKVKKVVKKVAKPKVKPKAKKVVKPKAKKVVKPKAEKVEPKVKKVQFIEKEVLVNGKIVIEVTDTFNGLTWFK